MIRRQRLAKAAPPAPGTAAPLFQLSDLGVEFVSLVPAGANRQRKWMVCKADGTAPALPPGQPAPVEPAAPAPPPPPAPTDKAAFCPYCGAALPVGATTCPGCDRQVPNLAAPPAPAPPAADGVEPVQDGCAAGGSTDEEDRRRRALAGPAPGSPPAPPAPAPAAEADTKATVPGAEATPEDRRAAQEARGKEYGIQVLAGPEAALTFPADAPTTLELYGDPVNLKYPLGGTGNTADPARIRNALARFKQAAATYTETASRGTVYGRIVAAALAAGIGVTYDSQDPIDQLLPGDLKARLEELNKAGAGATAPAPSPGGTPPSPGSDLSGWLTDVGVKVDALAVDAKLAAALASPQPVAAAAPAPAPAPTNKAPAIEAAGPGAVAKAAVAELASATAAAEALRLQLDAERAQNARLSKGVGTTVAMPTGERPTVNKAEEGKAGEAVARAWRGGGDLAAAVKPKP
jgi:hypothetical protein